MNYQTRILHRTVREISRRHPRIRGQVNSKIFSLEDNPRPQDIKPLKGEEDAYRVESGEYRILFHLDEKAKVVTIFRVRHRKDAYRGL
ncbi:MAG: type II toxin-antitoxin system RelE/ParE family toxin [Dehalococcoidia bacterium]|nr:type II toxin-antitoxin system RelE/ParE family toxin [Dehalococcoidia bacterium]